MGTVTRTVLFTDLADFTAAVSRSDREGLRRILSEHETLVAPIARRYRGRIVKNLGDSFLCLFDSATDAVRAGLEMQELVRGTEGTSMRVAMTTGDVEDIEGDAFGDAVNLAARILRKTPAGEVWFGVATHACMNAAEIPWEPVGRFRMKGIAGETNVFRAVPRDQCWLPEAVRLAAKRRRLVRIRRGERVPSRLAPDAVVLLEGFVPGSAEIEDVLGRLPVLDPASYVLSTYLLSPADRMAWLDTGRELVVGLPAAVDDALDDAIRQTSRGSGSDTIVIDVPMAADLEIAVAGLALPRVPLSEVVESYVYDLLDDGRWTNGSEAAVLRIEASQRGVTVKAFRPGVRMNGRSMKPGDVSGLEDGAVLQTIAGEHIFRALQGPYMGALFSESQMRLAVLEGQMAEIGREPKHPGLAFPDRRGHANIRWCAGPRAARARANAFTLDRALAGRRQAGVTLRDREVEVVSLHERCPTYRLRPHGNQLEQISNAMVVEFGDLLVAGTTVVRIRQPEQS